MNDQLGMLCAKYCRLGRVKGSELLLEPEVGRRFLSDIEGYGVFVFGVDVWHYIDREKGWIVEDWELSFSVPQSTIERHDSRESTRLALDFIQNSLPSIAEFISFRLDIRRVPTQM